MFSCGYDSMHSGAKLQMIIVTVKLVTHSQDEDKQGTFRFTANSIFVWLEYNIVVIIP